MIQFVSILNDSVFLSHRIFYNLHLSYYYRIQLVNGTYFNPILIFILIPHIF